MMPRIRFCYEETSLVIAWRAALAEIEKRPAEFGSLIFPYGHRQCERSMKTLMPRAWRGSVTMSLAPDDLEMPNWPARTVAHRQRMDLRANHVHASRVSSNNNARL